MSITVTGAFDDTRSPGVRLLERAARVGPVTVALWNDALVAALTGAPPRFPWEERAYFLRALRQVDRVTELDTWWPTPAPGAWALYAPGVACEPADASTWVDLSDPGEEAFAAPVVDERVGPGERRVVVTGCFDWIHTGHVRFFEEAAALGELYACLGNDATIEMLKGPGHPLFPAAERAFMVGSVRHVYRAVVSRGMGWLDAEPEIDWIRPHVYVVNEDGDKPEKRAFCADRGIEYRVLKRLPRPGLAARQSTDLRGF